jgi:LETM1 and EF-hand domain-containing protein 1
VPHHGYATGTDTHSGSNSSAPPPGFNVKEAQKPLAKDADKNSKEEATSEGKTLSTEEMKEATKIPREGPSVHAPTNASERQSLIELAAEKSAGNKEEEKKIAKKEEERKKLTLWQKVKKEAAHYWDGTKLLGTEVKISSRLAIKMAAGYELTRREQRQVCSILRVHCDEYSTNVL